MVVSNLQSAGLNKCIHRWLVSLPHSMPQVISTLIQKCELNHPVWFLYLILKRLSITDRILSPLQVPVKVSKQAHLYF